MHGNWYRDSNLVSTSPLPDHLATLLLRCFAMSKNSLHGNWYQELNLVPIGPLGQFAIKVGMLCLNFC